MCDDKKIIIYGHGCIGSKFSKILSLYPDSGYKVVGFTNSYDSYEGAELEEYEYIPRNQITKLVTDYIIIAISRESLTEEEVLNIKRYFEGEIDENKIMYWDEFVNILRKEKIILRYSESTDKEIQETLKWLRTHELTVRNQFENLDQNYYQVFTDEENGFPYIMFNGYRMYYPLTTRFVEREGKRWIINAVENDQYVGSPHLYVTKTHMVTNGATIVDAGVAEGNFVLSHINTIKKAYMFECEAKWLEVLALTFKPFKEKVVIIPKKLGDHDNNEYVTLDSVISENVNFVKMDIEGAEVPAILGGMELLKRSNAKLSICTYHRKNDEKYISFLLKALGYRTSYAKGRMFFMYDDDIDYSLDFRHGVMYGVKE